LFPSVVVAFDSPAGNGVCLPQPADAMDLVGTGDVAVLAAAVAGPVVPTTRKQALIDNRQNVRTIQRFMVSW
jgi:hypothetical protein